MTQYKLNGTVVSREEFLAGQRSQLFAPMVSNTYQPHDPLLSDGLGCMKAQVPEMRAAIKKRNIQGVVVRDSGQLEITSRRGRAEICEMRKLNDADGGYGDK